MPRYVSFWKTCPIRSSRHSILHRKAQTRWQCKPKTQIMQNTHMIALAVQTTYKNSYWVLTYAFRQTWRKRSTRDLGFWWTSSSLRVRAQGVVWLDNLVKLWHWLRCEIFFNTRTTMVNTATRKILGNIHIRSVIYLARTTMVNTATRNDSR